MPSLEEILRAALAGSVVRIQIEIRSEKLAACSEVVSAPAALPAPALVTPLSLSTEQAAAKRDADVAESQVALQAAAEKSANELAAEKKRKADVKKAERDAALEKQKEAAVCKACLDTKKNSKGAPCPICSGAPAAPAPAKRADPFAAPSPEAQAVPEAPVPPVEVVPDTVLIRLEQLFTNTAGASVEDLRMRCSEAYMSLSEEEGAAVLVGMHVTNLADIKAWNALSLRKFLEECVSIRRNK